MSRYSQGGNRGQNIYTSYNNNNKKKCSFFLAYFLRVFIYSVDSISDFS